ncbi:Methyltransferase type 12 [Shewanella halifaxensis HAW-EB4]|uniref:Methyltransferase type 12 n=1 Tax=Shewanella halifaxensis (strain HAW-EB4) TaxID=458817 RepID=B0TMY4_SHEHH|nr:class I SAM-dependent methyltransferase [Shewanella halifaxensis]ABZ78722.1 Methyltransferase type 12 [Shewanella halifaxensis HAW-EB4]
MDYLSVNQQGWDRRVQTHVMSEFYDVAGFLKGASSLQEIELAHLEVKGKSLLHLQCHFGLDTLSWARMGANVTGVDLSSAAITQARSLAEQAELNAEFICCDVYSVTERVAQQFDLVFTSYGAIVWLPDLDKWTQVIASKLVAGGQFYMVEFHPAQAVFEGYSYFHQDAPDVEDEVTYTENANDDTNTFMSWSHSLSDVINALIKAGLEVNSFNEFPFSPYNCFEGLTEETVEVELPQGTEQRQRYFVEQQGQRLPLTYAISATKKP